MTTTLNASTAGAGGFIATSDNSGVLALQTAGTTAITVDASQNVGIGTTSPPSVTNGRTVQISASGRPRLYTTSTGTNAVNTFFGSSDDLACGQIDVASNHPLVIYTNDTERMRIDSSGNLLVGTTSNIAANAKIFALGNGVGIAVGSGTGSTAYRHMYMNSGDGTLYFFNPTNYAYLSAAGAWTNASDARLKKNIVDIKYGLADVLKAQPRSYQMNAVDGDFVGFIAQELKEIIPEVVTGDPEKQLGVDYGSLVAVAFKAIQELKAINDTQAETINALTARIVALEQA
jgi:hypothetical protein